MGHHQKAKRQKRRHTHFVAATKAASSASEWGSSPWTTNTEYPSICSCWSRTPRYVGETTSGLSNVELRLNQNLPNLLMVSQCCLRLRIYASPSVGSPRMASTSLERMGTMVSPNTVRAMLTT